MRGNQVRLYFSSIAYIMMHDLRRLALKGTELERAQCTTIRLKLLKIGAQIQVTVRKVWVRMAAGYPYKEVFQQAVRESPANPFALLNIVSNKQINPALTFRAYYGLTRIKIGASIPFSGFDRLQMRTAHRQCLLSHNLDLGNGLRKAPRRR